MGDNGAGLQPELGDEAVGLGSRVGEPKAESVRFGVINLPGRVVRHARTLVINLSGGHPSYPVLVAARRSILALAHGPPMG